MTSAAAWEETPDKRDEPQVTWNVPPIKAKLEAARKDLLDLGLRNSLLNYRILRARGVEVIDEISAEIFRILVREGRTMTFLPRVGDAQPQSADALETIPAPRHIDRRLQTAVPATELQSRLLATYRAARTSIEEQGVNTLFLALGMLHWYDDKSSSQLRKAPLLLVPVELERSNVTERFHLRYTGDDIGSNPSLREKLRWEFGITLPETGDLEDLDVNGYLTAVAEAVRREDRWHIQPDEIALGFFSFAKLLMYEDLDERNWPAEKQPTDAPLLRALLEDTFHEPPSTYSDDADLDQEHPQSVNLPLVLDADSSQTIAILDVLDGRNLVIQGPPGTGKSQTIANLVAQAVAEGKTVLFVAEKLAALDVVKRRLERVGLGDACLALHSHTTQKKALLHELRRTLELGKPQPRDDVGDREQLDRSRARLNAYERAMNAPIGDSGISPHVTLGHAVRMSRRHEPETLRRLKIPGAASWSAADFQRRSTLIQELQLQLAQTGVPRTHPFWGSRRTALLPAEVEPLREKLAAARAANEQVVLAGTRLAEMLGMQPPNSSADIPPLLPRGWQLFRKWFGKDKAARGALQIALTRRQDQLNAVVQALELDEELAGDDPASLEDRPFEELDRLLGRWLQHLPELHALAGFNRLAGECVQDGLTPAVDLANGWARASTALLPALQYSWYDALLDRAYAERHELAHFSRLSHEQALQQFRALDPAIIASNSSRLAERHWQQLPTHSGAGQLAVLKREFEKKTRHLPIRQLMIKAGRPIQAIKPVFMMSPLSIANYLPPESLSFDLVIFDEASQVKPVDAFGALLRAKQAVVVGDSRQLPPTSFFDALTKGEELDEENVTSDIESILGLFSAQLAPSRMLRWHYRSRHESLIAVSNHTFYDDRLVVFPSPDAGREHLGLIYQHLDQSSYERGGSAANRAEAEIVARAVMEHARTRPRLSLGVAAFSVAQMQAIEDELEILRRQDLSCEPFFTSAHPHERFFIKNLETVQGDERDVIFISVGYGRTAEGRLSMSFGPVNNEGGERRLNVLFTRARYRCEVFTNLSAGDIEDRGKGAGVRALKRFLAYAETGRLDLPEHGDGHFDSPFEEAVWQELVSRGHTVRSQVGSAGFRIDLAVVDPQRPGHYLLGIECDGASYHSARSARDRDRLRQEVLEHLGWKIHRIWSPDWYADPEREIARLEAAIEEASHAPQTEPGPPGGMTAEGVELDRAAERVAPEPADPFADRYVVARISYPALRAELHEVPPPTLAGLVAQVVDVESPVHVSEVARRIAHAAGVQRIGNRIEANLERAFAYGQRNGSVQRRGEFLWKPGMDAAPVRDRCRLPAGSRKLELIAPEEIEAAVEKAVATSYGLEPGQVPAAVCRLLGINRTTAQMVEQIEGAVERLRASGRLTLQGSYVILTR